MAPRAILTACRSVAMACVAATLLGACDNPSASDPTPPSPTEGGAAIETARVTIDGRDFDLELALDDRSRFKGLSHRTEIKPTGGMLFVFPDAQVQVQRFVMRDCPIPIDIIYLDRGGRVTATHAMVPEPPRTEEEKRLSPPFPGAPEWSWVNPQYEARLRQYSSRYPAQFVIELKGGTLETLNVEAGDLVRLDRDALRRRAR